MNKHTMKDWLSNNESIPLTNNPLCRPTISTWLWDIYWKRIVWKVCWWWDKPDYLFIKASSCPQKLKLTVSEPNQYVITSELQMIEFLCATKVTRIQAEKEWCYIGCWKCSKKLQREISSFTCIVFDKTNDVGVLRYRVELSVSDKADDAVCLAWNAQIPTTVTYLFKSLLHLLINFCFSYSFYLS